jgi:hypothetical protein
MSNAKKLNPIITCRREGGLYTPDRDPTAPIRIYLDRSVEDDFLPSGCLRKNMSHLEYTAAWKAATRNRKKGFV